MCGGESNILIERAGNGFVIDAYEPSTGGDRPGEHIKHVTTSPEHVVHIVKKHLSKKARKEKHGKSSLKSVARKKG